MEIVKQTAAQPHGSWYVQQKATGIVEIWSPFCVGGPAAEWKNDKPDVLGLALTLVSRLNRQMKEGGDGDVYTR